MGSRIMATFEIQRGWILFAHPTKRITPNKMKRVREKQRFTRSLYPPASTIESKPLARLLLPDRLVPLVSVLIFIMGKEMLTRVLVELQDAVYT
jgi:hypothetical protein